MFHLFKRYWDNAESYKFTKFGPWGLVNCPWVNSDVIDHAKTTYSESRYSTEILGQFAKEESALFDPEDIETASKYNFEEFPQYAEVTGGLDWGQTHSTVLTLVQQEGDGVRVLYQEAWNGMRYSDVQDRIVKVCDNLRHANIYADSSHPGENERLIQKGVNVQPVYFSEDKDQMVENLLYLIENHKLKIDSRNTALKHQLSTYRRVRNKTGRSSYSKQNDDRVDSLMLALWGLKQEWREEGQSEWLWELCQ
jgi:hypothetical protein